MSQDIEIPVRTKQQSESEDISELFDSVDDMKRKLVRLTVGIDQELHRRFRIQCFNNSKQMTAVLRNFIEDYVDQSGTVHND